MPQLIHIKLKQKSGNPKITAFSVGNHPTKPHENIAKLNKITIPKNNFYTFVICITF